MRQWRATFAAERACEAARRGQVKSRHVMVSAQPAERLRQDIGVRRERAAGCPATSRTMASHEFDKWQVGLEFDQSAKTTAAHCHGAGLRGLSLHAQSVKRAGHLTKASSKAAVAARPATVQVPTQPNAEKAAPPRPAPTAPPASMVAMKIVFKRLRAVGSRA
jgi:hypothetical protein